MQIKDMDTKTGWITLEMQDTELRAITNLFYRARENNTPFGKKDYEVYSNLYTMISMLHCGYLPDFELNHIKELRDLSKGPNDDDRARKID